MNGKNKVRNYNEIQCLRWISSRVFQQGEADLTISLADGGKFANAVIRQIGDDHDIQLKLGIIAEFCKEMLGVRITRSNDIFGRKSIAMSFQISVIPHMPFTEEEDLKKFWLAHIQKTQIDEMCKLRLMTTKSEKVIAFCRRFSEEQK